MDIMQERNGFQSGSERMAADQYSQPPIMHDAVGSFGSEGKISNILWKISISFPTVDVVYNKSSIPEDGPGIEGFQIIGDAKPGCKLLGCGFPVRGTSLCMFQVWAMIFLFIKADILRDHFYWYVYFIFPFSHSLSIQVGSSLSRWHKAVYWR